MLPTVNKTTSSGSDIEFVEVEAEARTFVQSFDDLG